MPRNGRFARDTWAAFLFLGLIRNVYGPRLVEGIRAQRRSAPHIHSPRWTNSLSTDYIMHNQKFRMDMSADCNRYHYLEKGELTLTQG
jgi:hypothetical protein